MLVDFHCHTTRSDGVWPPEQLFAAIRSAGLSYFSVTDHDGMGAYPVPADLAPRCIGGMEIDAEHDDHTVHVLGYGIAPESPIVDALTAQRAGREDRARSIVERLQAAGVPLEFAAVAEQAGNGAIGRPHIARALVACGHVASVQAAFDRYLADEGSAYVALTRMSAAQIIDLVHGSGGIAVAAHPLRLRRKEHLDELVACGLDGVEVVHPTADAAAVRDLLAFTRERGLLATGGSDFHSPEGGHRLGVRLARDTIEAFVAAIRW